MSKDNSTPGQIIFYQSKYIHTSLLDEESIEEAPATSIFLCISSNSLFKVEFRDIISCHIGTF